MNEPVVMGRLQKRSIIQKDTRKSPLRSHTNHKTAAAPLGDATGVVPSPGLPRYWPWFVYLATYRWITKVINRHLKAGTNWGNCSDTQSHFDCFTNMHAAIRERSLHAEASVGLHSLRTSLHPKNRFLGPITMDWFRDTEFLDRS